MEIIGIVRDSGPITGKQIADRLSLSRAALRPDLAILTMAGTIEARPRVGYFLNNEKSVKEPPVNPFSQTVSDYKAHPIVIQNAASVYEAIVQLFLEDVGTLYVVDENNHLAGVISRKDLLRASIGNRNMEELPVSIIMTRMPNVVTIHPEATLIEAARKMITYQIDSLPVVKESEQETTTYTVIGRITKTTITKAFLELSGK
ncbi:transcriptional regulator [Bacillus sp. FJAT-27225]|uniref:helix-turn-helix transcriptional regulator n=1 Tax=Bacillus sp. FJAT-27225 TaxID=1743144 RepID=UPI00080C2AAC|nr:helix-turn-helix transcriptional regulator [Bacillus sp. FJAT-27225]OCA90744.1 transcriptional regulator [Bacillus sp. FJAT-27225]